MTFLRVGRLTSHERKTVSTTQRESISVECEPPAYRPTEVWTTKCTNLNMMGGLYGEKEADGVWLGLGLCTGTLLTEQTD